jgi:hypothetical protein
MADDTYEAYQQLETAIKFNIYYLPTFTLLFDLDYLSNQSTTWLQKDDSNVTSSRLSLLCSQDFLLL